MFRDKKKYLIIVIIFFSSISYLGLVNNYFLSDDFSEIYIAASNTSILEVLKLHDATYRPIAVLPIYFVYTIWGNNVTPHHFINLFFHILSGILVYLLLLKISEKHIWSLICGILFTVHWTHVETIAWYCVFTHRVEIGPLGIYYLFLIKGYCFAPGLKISQKEVYPNIYFSNPKDPYLLYTFYNNGSAQDMLLTGRVIKDKDKIADHIMENPEDFDFAQDLIEQMNLKYELNLIRGIDSFDTILFDFEHRDNRKTSFRLVNSKTKNKSETVWLTAV